jgi:hypothetical protein
MAGMISKYLYPDGEGSEVGANSRIVDTGGQRKKDPINHTRYRKRPHRSNENDIGLCYHLNNNNR